VLILSSEAKKEGKVLKNAAFAAKSAGMVQIDALIWGISLISGNHQK